MTSTKNNAPPPLVDLWITVTVLSSMMLSVLLQVSNRPRMIFSMLPYWYPVIPPPRFPREKYKLSLRDRRSHLTNSSIKVGLLKTLWAASSVSIADQDTTQPPVPSSTGEKSIVPSPSGPSSFIKNQHSPFDSISTNAHVTATNRASLYATLAGESHQKRIKWSVQTEQYNGVDEDNTWRFILQVWLKRRELTGRCTTLHMHESKTN